MIMTFIYSYLFIGLSMATCIVSFIYHPDFWSKGMADDVKKQMDEFREGYTELNSILVIVVVYLVYIPFWLPMLVNPWKK